MKKARFFKFTILFIFLTSLILSLLAILIVYHYPKEKILAIVTSKAENILDRKVIIKEISYSLQGIRLTDIDIYNNLYPDTDLPGSDLFASLKNAEIRFSLLPLLNKQFIINKIFLNNFNINIFYKEGKSNIKTFLSDLKVNGGSDIEIKISSIGIKDAEITLTDPPERLKPLEGRYIFSGIIDLSGKDSISIYDCRLILSDNRGRIGSDDIGISRSTDDFELSGDLRLDDCSLLWVYGWRENSDLPYLNFTGDIIKLRVTKNLISGFVNGKSMLTNSKEAFVDGQCKVNIDDKSVELINVDGGVDRSKFFINELEFSYNKTLKKKIIKFNITDIDSNINDMKPVLSFLPAKVFGGVSGSLSYKNKNYNGILNLRNAGYWDKGKALLKVSGEVPIVNNNIHVEKIPAFIIDQPCQLSIDASGTDFQRLILNIYSKEFNYIFDKEKASRMDLSNIKSESEITGQVEIDNLNINDFNLTKLFINYAFRNGILNINRINCKFMGGNVNANGYLDISRAKPYIDLKTDFEDIKVQNLADLDEEYSGRFFGIAKGNADFEFGIDKGVSLFNSLKGKMEINIDKGKLVNTGIQRGLGIWLSELRYKLRDLEFNKIYGNVNIIGKNIYVNSMLFNAPDIRLKMDGYFSAPVQKDEKMPGDLKIDLEFNDYFIQDIPNLPQTQLISKLLKIPTLKKKGDWYIMHFQDKGEDVTNSDNIKPL